MGTCASCIGSSNNDFMENLTNNNYINLNEKPHIVKITNKKSNKVFLIKKCKSEHEAVSYLNEAREFQSNKDKFNFVISGPNMFYSV